MGSADMKQPEMLGDRFQHWLLANLPPLSGRLRLVFYGGSLVLFFVRRLAPL